MPTQPQTTGSFDLAYIDGKNWRLATQFSFRRPEIVNIVPAIEIIVPAGFETDFASVPWFFRRIFPPAGDGPNARWGPASVIHDYLYRTGTGTRRDADRIFREVMAAEGVVWWKRWAMWTAVRLFGWMAWQRKTDLAAKGAARIEISGSVPVVLAGEAVRAEKPCGNFEVGNSDRAGA